MFIEATQSIVENKNLLPIEKSFKSIKFLTEGGFGSIYKGKPKKGKLPFTGPVAIKKLLHNNRKEIERNLCEIGFLAISTHPQIVKFKGAYVVHSPNDTEEVWIITEFIEGGVLSDAVKSGKLFQTQIAFIIKELLSALQFLHSHNYAHRDIKSSNILISSATGTIKLIDFGLCADFTSGPRVEIVGSSFWIPPEMILQRPHNCSVDIWSMGVCIIEMLTSNPPYHQSRLHCMYKVATEGLQPLVTGLDAKADVKDFLSKCLSMDPASRPTVMELLQHPWLKQPYLEDCFKILVKQVFLTKSVGDLNI